MTLSTIIRSVFGTSPKVTFSAGSDDNVFSCLLSGEYRCDLRVTR
jgi:hypothetical protein